VPELEWRISDGLVEYPAAMAEMEARAAALRDGRAGELVWLLQHPPLYTAGTSAREGDLLQPGRFPVFHTGRGGQFTYHGPGQRVVYLVLDLKRRRPDVRAYVRTLETWIIAVLARFNLRGERREGRVGIWIDRNRESGVPAGGGEGRPVPAVHEDKIAAIGVRIRRWVTLHGLAINVDPALGDFGGIVPCGIRGGLPTIPGMAGVPDVPPAARFGVTSLVDLGLPVTLADVDLALRETFDATFAAMDMAPRAVPCPAQAGTAERVA